MTSASKRRLNPFGAGRGLSTSKLIEKLSEDKNVSIPFKQGGVFRHNVLGEKDTTTQSFNPFGTGQGLSTDECFIEIDLFESQSLWNRAESFDPNKKLMLEDIKVSIPLEQGRVFRLD